MSGDTDYANAILARISSSGGAGVADATASNQLSQMGLETEIRDRIGEILANPTANTLADRLKTLATLLSGGLPAALVSGRLSVDSYVAARTPVTTSVASSATSVLVLAANADRRGLTILNRSTGVLTLSYSNPATLANSFTDVQPGAFLSMAADLVVPVDIYGLWSAVNGTAQVTEYA